MKIKDLIDKLEEYDLEMEVDIFNRENGEREEVLRIEQTSGSVLIVPKVWLPF